MHVKYALALVLVLQVSLSLCEIPAPSEELVEKYNALKTTFFERINRLGLKEKIQAAVAQSEMAMTAKAYLDSMEPNPNLLAAEKIAKAIAEEVESAVDKARMSLLGLYEYYLRAHIGERLDRAITNVKPFLNAVMPAN